MYVLLRENFVDWLPVQGEQCYIRSVFPSLFQGIAISFRTLIRSVKRNPFLTPERKAWQPLLPPRRILSCLLLLPVIFLVVSCNELTGEYYGRISEGEIVYDVSYPYADTDGLMASFLPDKMTMKFKKDRFITEISSAKVFKNSLYADRTDSTAEQRLKLMGKKVKVTMDRKEVQQLVKDFPDMTVFKGEGVDTVAGYPCKKAIAIFDAIDQPAVEVYYTEEIAMKDPNWCNQYHKIDGVLLAYEIERFGIRMRLRAKAVKPRTVKPKEFRSEGYEEVSMRSMEKELKDIAKNFDL